MRAEEAIVFDCEGERLVGIVHHGEADARLGIVIVVGGPQYRVGSHRQFVATARQFASSGLPVLRFDYRGMGDSDGGQRSFDTVDADIGSSISALYESYPTLEGVVLYGLCDAASAVLLYACTDARVAGLVLINPWVRTEETEARSFLKHYYLQRLSHWSFWKKVLLGKIQILRSLCDFLRSVSTSLQGRNEGLPELDFRSRMLISIERFANPVLIMLSGRDLTAKEFMDLAGSDKLWKQAVQRSNISWKEFQYADHTFSAESDLEASAFHVEKWCCALIRHT